MEDFVVRSNKTVFCTDTVTSKKDVFFLYDKEKGKMMFQHLASKYTALLFRIKTVIFFILHYCIMPPEVLHAVMKVMTAIYVKPCVITHYCL